MKVTIPQTVWLSDPTKATDLNPDLPQVFMQQISLCDPALKMESMGWIKIGFAEIFVTIEVEPQKITADAIVAMKKKLEKMDAEYEKTRQGILDKISKLSALEWDGGRIKS